MYKQSNAVTIHNKKVKNLYWKVLRWGKDERIGKAYVEVLHWFVKTEPLTSGSFYARYEKTMAGDPNLSKVEAYLLTLPEYLNSVAQ